MCSLVFVVLTSQGEELFTVNTKSCLLYFPQMNLKMSSRKQLSSTKLNLILKLSLWGHTLGVTRRLMFVLMTSPICYRFVMSLSFLELINFCVIHIPFCFVLYVGDQHSWDFGSSGPGLSPGVTACIVSLGITLSSHSSSLHLYVPVNLYIQG